MTSVPETLKKTIQLSFCMAMGAILARHLVRYVVLLAISTKLAPLPATIVPRFYPETVPGTSRRVAHPG
ncbi:hypothetical protein CGRA01v4_03432 [Colletotrichum graminicola]|nr:hypothetical protein CGRA01v4_03432 [Colletotrichum graminicola]